MHLQRTLYTLDCLLHETILNLLQYGLIFSQTYNFAYWLPDGKMSLSAHMLTCVISLGLG